MPWGFPGLCHHIKLKVTCGQCPDPAPAWPVWGMRWGVFIFCAGEKTVPTYEDFFFFFCSLVFLSLHSSFLLLCTAALWENCGQQEYDPQI